MRQTSTTSPSPCTIEVLHALARAGPRARAPCAGACAIRRERACADACVRRACTGIGRTRGLGVGANANAHACAGASAGGGWAGDSGGRFPSIKQGIRLTHIPNKTKAGVFSLHYATP
jgi:hypothetical protein